MMTEQRTTLAPVSILLAAVLAAGGAAAQAPTEQPGAQPGMAEIAPGDASMEMAPTGDAASFSAVETTLWLTDQLALIDKPTRLRYDFERSGSYDVGFSDTVEMDVIGFRPDGSKGVVVRFFSGERNMWTPPFESVTGNPVLGLYLQGDTYEMNRLTEGNWRYFHRRIKTAFAEKSELTPVEIEFEGRKLQAQQVRIEPYALDPRRSRYEQFADKYYLITVSADIPGHLYEIRTVIPGEIRPDGTRSPEPLIEERLVLSAVEALPADAAVAPEAMPDEATAE